MRRSLQPRRDKRCLKFWLTVFFLALIIPAGFLVQHAYSQLKWEAFHRHRLMAEEFATRLDRKFIDLIDTEEAHSFADYGFLVVSGDPAANFLQRSALSAYPVDSQVPGLVGYFQIDTGGVFSTPLMPPPGISPLEFGVSSREIGLRRALENRILHILDKNQLVQQKSEETRRLSELAIASPAVINDELAGIRKFDYDRQIAESETVTGQAAFDRLNKLRSARQTSKQKAATLGRVEDLKFDPGYQQSAGESRSDLSQSQMLRQPDLRSSRKEQSAVYEQKAEVARESSSVSALVPDNVRVSIFESQIDAFEFALLDSGQFVLFRKVWRGGQRYIQGALIEPKVFFDSVITSEFRGTALSLASNLAVAYAGEVFSAYSGQQSRQYLDSADELQGSLLYKTHLSAPLGNAELILSIIRLPAGPGSTVITWMGFVLLLVLCIGLILMYRLGAAQIDLANQQQNFVSAVSHELKTPLTSIRMYSEMLREGWADEDKKKTYYNYIHDESERLSRLISNVLQLARMTRNDLQLDLKPVTVSELMDGVRSKVSSQIEGAGFKLNISALSSVRYEQHGSAATREIGPVKIDVDTDAFTQIIINLVDNAIKFSANADKRSIDIYCDLVRDTTARFRVRDYGPGVPGDQMKKIFKLFYRSENELTRDTIGTGIGLALVNQLTLAMNGRIDVVNRKPGVEFVVEFSVSGS